MGATTILGINAWHGDASACLVVDGELVGAVEEERFTRRKHQAGFPVQAVRWCLEEHGVASEALDHVAINRDPTVQRWSRIGYALRRRPDLAAIVDRVRNRARVRGTEGHVADALGVEPSSLRARFHAVEHHLAHLASAYLVSPFERAAIASVDGFGDFSSAMWALGDGARIETLGRVSFPHSLGLYYLALTQHLGFPHYGDEYKVMGMAAYGEPTRLDDLRRVVRATDDGGYELELAYFRHHNEHVEMSWEEGAPAIGRAFSTELERLLGPPRRPEEPLERRHFELAASIQARYEELFFHLLEHLHRTTGERRLALAGGCAMNSLANGRIPAATEFRDVYVQPAAGDAGGALGAAFAVWNGVLGHPRSYALNSAALGPGATVAEIDAAVADVAAELTADGCVVERPADEAALCTRTAQLLANGAVVGWYQGRAEWGPRALGNRSILADPRRGDMREVLNGKIKRRESFRPFAPSILRERVLDWFDLDGDVPFMGQVFPLRAERHAEVPAVVHRDGSGRLQTVSADANPRYHRLIEAFERETGVPMVLNTSFNENEPIVLRPEEALDCFRRTHMDALVLGDVLIRRPSSPEAGNGIATS